MIKMNFKLKNFNLKKHFISQTIRYMGSPELLFFQFFYKSYKFQCKFVVFVNANYRLLNLLHTDTDVMLNIDD